MYPQSRDDVSRLEKPWRPFVVLVSSDSEITARSLESVLTMSGYSVLQSRSGEEAFALACSAQPDAVILDDQSPENSNVDFCRRLIGSPRFSAITPVILTTTQGDTRRERLAAFTAGAWDICSHPVDGSMLLLKLQTFIRAKVLAERARGGGLLDEATGLYNAEGLIRRAVEVGADAYRRRLPLSCLIFSTTSRVNDDDGEVAVLDSSIEHLAHICSTHARASDVVGRFDRRRFAVIAPATDSLGAERLLHRLHGALANRWPTPIDSARPVRFLGGVCASDDYAAAGFSVHEMLATAARNMALLS